MRYLLAFGSTGVVLAALSFPLSSALSDDGKGPGKENKPMKVEDAEKLVRAFIFAENPRMNPAAQFPLKEITTKEVWDGLGVQVFQITEGVQARETLVLANQNIYRIGVGFGGQGVTSLAVADPSGDGRPKLIYAYSWGSGEHRSQIGVFDCLAKEPKQVLAPQAYFGDLGDLAVTKGKGKAVEVYAGKQKVGLLDLSGKEGELKAAIRLDKDLPARVKEGFTGIE